MKYISFKEYKDKLKEGIKQKIHKNSITDEQILEQGMKIVQAYENQQKVGDSNGNI